MAWSEARTNLRPLGVKPALEREIILSTSSPFALERVDDLWRDKGRRGQMGA
jgi:hypothetical protein